MSLALRPLVAAVVAAGLAPCPDPVLLVHRMPSERTVAVTLRQSETSSLVSQNWHLVTDGTFSDDETGEVEAEEESSFEVEILFEDRYGESAEGGAPKRLERTFTAIDASVEWTHTDGEETVEGDARWTTPLLDRTVVFRREADGYAAAFESEDDESGFDDVLLAGMHVDAFGNWYLPPQDAGAVEPGDSWDAGVDAWHRTLDIGGDFWVGPEMEEPPDPQTVEERRTMRGQLRSGGEGVVRCTFARLETIDGVELAVVEIELELEVGAERAEDGRMAIVLEDGEVEDELDARWTTAVEQSIEGEGRLLWNVAEGLPHALELSVEMEIEERSTEELEVGGTWEGDGWITVRRSRSEIEVLFRARD